MTRSLTVWILQTGEPLHVDDGDPRPMRAMNLANALLGAGHRVVLWSARFNHQTKRHRPEERAVVTLSDRFVVRLLPSRGYRRNVGLERLVDHLQVAWNLKRALRSTTDLPDVAFVGYPPIETAAVMTRWLRRRGVPCVVDVKDQWPHLFLRAIPTKLRWLGRFGLLPYYFFGRRSIRDATGVTAMADGFLDWARGFSARSPGVQDGVFPLTAPEGQVAQARLEEALVWWNRRGVRADGPPRVMFVGTHAPTVDFRPVSEAARQLAIGGQLVVQFVICGEGSSTSEWRAAVAGLPNVVFPGWVNRAQIEVLAKRSVAALIPYRNTDDFQRSIPNKVLDALSFGLPILSPLRGEVANLIASYDVGLRYGADAGRTLEECVRMLVGDQDLRRRMSERARGLFQKRFSFERVYGGLVRHLESLAQDRGIGNSPAPPPRYPPKTCQL